MMQRISSKNLRGVAAEEGVSLYVDNWAVDTTMNISAISNRLPAFLCIIVLCLMVAVSFSGNVFAQNTPPSPPPTGNTCTSDPFYTELDKDGSDLLNAVMQTMSGVLDSSSEGLYKHFINDSGYQLAVAGIITLYVTIYGIMIMFQMVPITGGEFVLRLVKIGVLLTIVSPGGWAFFSFYVRDFFTVGMNEFIVMFNNISLGRNDPLPTSSSTVAATAVLTGPIQLLLSSRLYITLLAMIFTGPYGLVYTLLLLWAIVTLAYVLVGALATYIKALVGLYFLFAIAPIFFLFLLFKTTKHMFDGWISQVVNFTLQPIFIFAFLGFFMELIMAPMSNIVKIPVCYTKIKFQDMGDIDYHLWRFEVPLPIIDPNIPQRLLSPTDYILYDGAWGFCGPTRFCGSIGCGTCTYGVFPVDIMDILMLIFMTQLAYNYTKFVGQLATEVAGASASVSVGAQSVRNWLLTKGIAPGQLAAGAVRTGARTTAFATRTTIATGRMARRVTGGQKRASSPSPAPSPKPPPTP